jgi:hypothetical protein
MNMVMNLQVAERVGNFVTGLQTVTFERRCMLYIVRLALQQ